MKTANSRKAVVLVAASFVALAAAWLALAPDRDPEMSAEDASEELVHPPGEDLEDAALAECALRVKNQLRSLTDLRLPDSDETTIEAPKGRLQISGTATGRAANGEHSSIEFTCLMRRLSDGRWIAEDLRLRRR